MIGFLRFIRGFCGFIFASQIIGIIGTMAMIGQTEGLSSGQEGAVFAFIFIKIIVAIIFGGVYFYFRKLINNIYQKRTGSDELLLKTKWSL